MEKKLNVCVQTSGTAKKLVSGGKMFPSYELCLFRI